MWKNRFLSESNLLLVWKVGESKQVPWGKISSGFPHSKQKNITVIVKKNFQYKCKSTFDH